MLNLLFQLRLMCVLIITSSPTSPSSPFSLPPTSWSHVEDVEPGKDGAAEAWWWKAQAASPPSRPSPPFPPPPFPPSPLTQNLELCQNINFIRKCSSKTGTLLYSSLLEWAENDLRPWKPLGKEICHLLIHSPLLTAGASGFSKITYIKFYEFAQYITTSATYFLTASQRVFSVCQIVQNEPFRTCVVPTENNHKLL